VVVDEYDGLTLLRSSPDAPPQPEGVAELARSLANDEADQDVFTVVVGAEGGEPGLWTRLGTVLDTARERGATTVRLALSGAGGERPDRPAMAQRIADAWKIEVIAPEAGVVIVPGGALFAVGAGAQGHGWRSFTPGAESTPLGPRSPAPSWQPALAGLPGRTVGGHVVEQVPAGILVRPAQAPKARAGDLCYAVPVDHDHPAVLVGASEPRGDADVPAEDLAALLAALPAPTRSTIRLTPCGPVDLLPVGQDTAEILGAEVEVLTGLPVILGAGTEPLVRPLLIGADAQPTWAPFVEAVACRPYGADGSAPAPRLVRWRRPVPGGGAPENGGIPLSDRWQVSVTRAGLVVGPRGEPPILAGRPVSPEQLAIEVNLRSAPADDALFDDLSQLLSDLGTGVRQFVTLHRLLPPGRSEDEDFRLLRLAIKHGVSLAEPPPAQAAPAPATPTVRTVAIPRARPPQEPAGRLATAPLAGSPATAPPAGVPSAAVPPAVAPPAARAGSTAPVINGSVREPGPANPPPAAERPTRAAQTAPHRRTPGGGTKPLPPSLGRIPLTPVTPRPPEPPGSASESPGTPPESPGGAAEPAPSASAPSVPAAPTSPSAPTEPAALAESEAPTGSGSPAEPAEPSPPPAPARPAASAGFATPTGPAALGTPPGPRAPTDPGVPATSPGAGATTGSAAPAGPATPAESSAPPPSALPSASPSAPRSAGPPAGPATPPSRPTEAVPQAPSGPVLPSTPPAGVRPEPAAGGARATSSARPVRRSTEAERTEFRSLAQPVWERHSAAVNRAMTRMPALRGAQVDAARTDLVAVHIHLSGGHGELGHREPDGAGIPACYAACLASGLCRLPSYRGVAVRGGLPADGGLERFVPGTLLRDPEPVSALPIGVAADLSATAGGYVIWSFTGRRVRPLLGAGPGSASDEVVFPSDTGFRVLDVRSAGPAPIVLLSEVRGAGSGTGDRPGVLDEADRVTLARLDEALSRQVPSPGGTTPATWPARCTEPLGETGRQ
jgi:hypothetical protein